MKNAVVNSLNSISPIDGRYRNQIEKLSRYFSEKALIYYRLVVEIEYFISLVEIPLPELKTFPLEKIKYLKKIYEKFTDEDALEVKKIEKKTNHDVKAIEYFLKDKFDLIGVSKFKEFIHFGLTSQDINIKEVEDWKWVDLSFLEQDLDRNPNIYTEWFKIIFKRVKGYILPS